MPISDFRKNKLVHVFNTFFDINQSGSIDKKDFDLAIENICKLRKWDSGSAQAKATQETMYLIWEGIRQTADSNNDDQVTIDEWFEMWESYAKNPNAALPWQLKYMDFMFSLEDTSNDGTIDGQEFATVYSSYGLNLKECEDAFKKMAQGSPEVTKEQFAVLWKEYFTSDDVSSPGNSIFGKSSF